MPYYRLKKAYTYKKNRWVKKRKYKKKSGYQRVNRDPFWTNFTFRIRANNKRKRPDSKVSRNLMIAFAAAATVANPLLAVLEAPVEVGAVETLPALLGRNPYADPYLYNYNFPLFHY